MDINRNDLSKRFLSALTSAELVFPEREQSEDLSALFSFFRRAMVNLNSEEPLPNPVVRNLSDDCDPLIPLNHLAVQTLQKKFTDELDKWIFQSACSLFSNCRYSEIRENIPFFLSHANRLRGELASLIPDYIAFLTAQWKSGNEILRIYPGWKNLLSCHVSENEISADVFYQQIERQKTRSSLFRGSHAYRYCSGEFHPLNLYHIRPVSNFYGYRDARRILSEHYSAFSEGGSNLPLLISSLPGLGKTQMNISHVLNHKNLILILPEPEDIAQGLEKLLSALKDFPEYRFVLFFDDIEADKTDWYFFRTQVGGTFSLPENITITVASNQTFPASVSSRGRGFTFPIFDEIRCMEMVSDYLAAHGMRNPESGLICVIASDYVESFGQRKFEELSPRTLVRYLEQLNADREKREKMLKFSQGDMIPRPDSQVFYEENLKLMKSIYGESVIEDFRNQELYGKNI